MVGQKVTLILQQLVNISDKQGGFTEKYSSKRKIKGTIENVNSNEKFYGETRTVFITHRFYCDYQTGITITNKDRFVFGSRILNIIDVINTAEQDRFLEFLLKEVS